ncbi:MICOS complex subunit mic60 [Smittium mucronatum]|uniref:MICOS complex subunit MIC60 n=1 Tax=Smittium mucronatum TaxID=133383 RepID=A0A1R0GXM1_9FUNG|nr:MICOS complex subunit mic60 [Smittium mucronatum]
MLRIYSSKLLSNSSRNSLSSGIRTSRFSSGYFLSKEKNPESSPIVESKESSTEIPSSKLDEKDSQKTSSNDKKTSESVIPPITDSSKPKTKKARFRKLKFITTLGIVFGVSVVGGGIYTSKAQEDDEYAVLYKKYMPLSTEFLSVMERNNNNSIDALLEIGNIFASDLKYSADFVSKHFISLKNMIVHNNWEPETKEQAIKNAMESFKNDAKSVFQSSTENGSSTQTDISSVTAPVAESSDNSETEHFSNPSSTVKLSVDIPINDSIEPLMTELSLRVRELVQIINKYDLSKSHLAEIRDVTITISKLDDRFYDLQDEKKNDIKNALENAQKETDALIAKLKVENDEKIKESEQKNEAVVSEAVQAAKRDAAAEFEVEKYELIQSLEARFNRMVSAKVDEERDGRLSRMENVESQFIDLSSTSSELVQFINRVRLGNQFKLKASALNSVVNGNDNNKSWKSETINSTNVGTGGKVIITSRPFVHELQALKSLCDPEHFPASTAAINSDSLLRISSEGIASFAQLSSRFEYVAREIKKISLVPENSGLFSHMSSMVLSKVMFNKHGLVDGNDVEAVLARAEFFLKERDLDLAAREVNQLTGWPKALSEDWLSAARDRLEVEQLLQIVDAEETLFRLQNL